jgi:predicted signal transduction protein with EAL and GGDEF domain
VFGRLSADEFIIVLPDLETSGDVHPIARRIRLSLSEAFRLEERDVYLSASIGVAHSHESGHDAAQLLEQADAAMYRAKELGRDRLEVFDHQMRTRARARLQIEHDLRRAVEQGELTVHYQPGIALDTGQICGAEALLRWEHPERGMIYPDSFIPVAEETGLIVPIGRYVLEEAISKASEWTRHLPHLEEFKIAVNLSARELVSPNLVDHVADVLNGYGFPADHLSLELTESILIDDAECSLDVLRQLKDLGVTLAIDDFGTGYSSLSYLHRFPVDCVKIDRAFVNQLNADGTGSAVTTAVMNMASALDIMSSAEGVETEDQLAGLRRLECSCAQGFLFAQAMPANELATLLESKKSW